MLMRGKTPDLLKLGIAFAGSVSLQFPICLHLEDPGILSYKNKDRFALEL